MSNASQTPVMGVKLMKMCEEIVIQSECKVDTAKAVRHFMTNTKSQRRFGSYCSNDDPNFSLKLDMNKTTDFHSFKSSSATKKQIANGAGIFSPTQMEDIEESLKERGLTLDDLI
jgi:hypothetical protein